MLLLLTARELLCMLPWPPTPLLPGLPHKQLHLLLVPHAPHPFCRSYVILKGTVLTYFRSERDVQFPPRGRIDLRSAGASTACRACCVQLGF